LSKFHKNIFRRIVLTNITYLQVTGDREIIDVAADYAVTDVNVGFRQFVKTMDGYTATYSL